MNQFNYNLKSILFFFLLWANCVMPRSFEMTKEMTGTSSHIQIKLEPPLQNEVVVMMLKQFLIKR